LEHFGRLGSRRVKAGFDKRWLLPFGVLSASALVALGLVVFGPSSFGDSSGEEVGRPAASEAVVADCSGASATDYACYKERYRALVLDSGVEAAFADLKYEHEKSGFVRAACHQLTHVIGRTAAERYGDVAGAYSRGDPFCSSGYYHGVTEAFVGRIGAENMLDKADELCADLREHQKYSLYHFGCAHGLGHGFMDVLENELFESLDTCDALKDGWEREACSGGVFMENVMAMDNPSHPSEYLKADQPLYPCTAVETRHKNECYKHQTGYALFTRSDDYAKVFNLCATVEDEPHPGCYQGLGKNAALHSIKYVIGDVAKAEATRRLCMLGADHEARSNCVIGAVRAIINYYNSDVQAKALCETFEADLRTMCFQEAEEHYKEAAFLD
jgi:hypothetical protein